MLTFLVYAVEVRLLWSGFCLEKISVSPMFKRVLALAVALSLAFFSALSSSLSVDYVEPVATTRSGCGLYIDGVFIAACDDADTAVTAVNAVYNAVSDIYSVPDGESVPYNDVRYVTAEYETALFTELDTLTELLGGCGESFSFTVKDYSGTDTGIELKVMTKSNAVLTETLDYGTLTVETDLLSVGQSVVVVDGVNGVAENSYEYTYVNGILSETVLKESVVMTEASAEEVWVGSESGAMLLSAGELLMLPYDGVVTSWYGYRDLFGGTSLHGGIDFANYGGCYGDPIYAAADGIVSFADWHSGYGMKLVIDHNSSISTVYAHCSEFLVEEGQAVHKGQAIALIGNTGKVTGAHLHFEVIVDGVRCNPRQYVDWSNYAGALN